MRNKLIIILLVLGNSYCSLPDSPKRLSNASTCASSGDEGLFDLRSDCKLFVLDSRSTCPIEDENPPEELTVVDKLEKCLLQSRRICWELESWLVDKENSAPNYDSLVQKYEMIVKEYNDINNILDNILDNMIYIYRSLCSVDDIYKFSRLHTECGVHFINVLAPLKHTFEDRHSQYLALKNQME